MIRSKGEGTMRDVDDILKCPRWPGLSQAEARSQELQSGLPCAGKGPQLLGASSAALPGCTFAGSWTPRQRASTQNGTTTWGVGGPGSVLIYCASKAHCRDFILKDIFMREILSEYKMCPYWIQILVTVKYCRKEEKKWLPLVLLGFLMVPL